MTHDTLSTSGRILHAAGELRHKGHDLLTVVGAFEIARELYQTLAESLDKLPIIGHVFH